MAEVFLSSRCCKAQKTKIIYRRILRIQENSFFPTLEALIKGKPALTSNSRHFYKSKIVV